MIRIRYRENADLCGFFITTIILVIARNEAISFAKSIFSVVASCLATTILWLHYVSRD
jgi:hypothetical protein